jgi:transcriptional regulator with XRE-family HTH domain
MAFYQPNKDLRVFGKRLTAHRDSQGLSRMALACSVNVSQEHIWRLENGFRGSSRDLTIIIGQVLKLDKEQINELLMLAGHRPMIKKGGLSENRFPPKNGNKQQILPTQFQIIENPS